MSLRIFSRYHRLLSPISRRIFDTNRRELSKIRYLSSSSNNPTPVRFDSLSLDEFFGDSTQPTASSSSSTTTKIAAVQSKPSIESTSSSPKNKYPPLDEQELANFNELLGCLHRREECPKEKILVNAPKMALRIDYEHRKRFVDLIDEYWRQYKLLAEKKKRENNTLAASSSEVDSNVGSNENFSIDTINWSFGWNLFNLLELDREFDGKLMQKFGDGGKFLDEFFPYWIESMMNSGGSPFWELSKGLRALNHIRKYAPSNLKRSTRFDEFKKAIDGYIRKNCELEIDDQNSCRRASNVLTLLRRLEIRPSMEALRVLNRLALNDISIGGTYWPYADAFLFWRIDPSVFDPNSFDIWYRVFYDRMVEEMKNRGDHPSTKAEEMKNQDDRSTKAVDQDTSYPLREITTHTLSLPPSLACYFPRALDQFNNKIFYDRWHRMVSMKIKAKVGDRLPAGVTAHRYLPDLIRSINTLIDRSQKLGIRNRRCKVTALLGNEIVSKLDQLSDEIMENFSTTMKPSDHDVIPWIDVARTFSNYARLKRSTKGGGKLSTKVAAFLRQYLVNIRRENDDQSQRSNSHRRSISTEMASTILLAFSTNRMNAPNSILDELSRSFFYGLSSIVMNSDDDEISAISSIRDFGDACVRYNYDPSRAAAIGERAWPTWFRACGRILESSLFEKASSSTPMGNVERRRSNSDRSLEENIGESTSSSADVRIRRLLIAIPKVSSHFQRSIEFERIKPIWERAVLKFYDNDRDAEKIKKLEIGMEKKFGLVVDSKISTLLERKLRK